MVEQIRNGRDQPYMGCAGFGGPHIRNGVVDLTESGAETYTACRAARTRDVESGRITEGRLSLNGFIGPKCIEFVTAVEECRSHSCTLAGGWDECLRAIAACPKLAWSVRTLRSI